MSVCLFVRLSVCPVCALTSQSLNLQTSLWCVCRCIFRISGSSSYIKVIESRSRSLSQGQGHRSKKHVCDLFGNQLLNASTDKFDVHQVKFITTKQQGLIGQGHGVKVIRAKLNTHRRVGCIQPKGNVSFHKILHVDHIHRKIATDKISFVSYHRLVSKMTYYVSSGTLNPTYSLTHSGITANHFSQLIYGTTDALEMKYKQTCRQREGQGVQQLK